MQYQEAWVEHMNSCWMVAPSSRDIFKKHALQKKENLEQEKQQVEQQLKEKIASQDQILKLEIAAAVATAKTESTDKTMEELKAMSEIKVKAAVAEAAKAMAQRRHAQTCGRSEEDEQQHHEYLHGRRQSEHRCWYSDAHQKFQ